MSDPKKTGADELRTMVKWLDNTRENVLDRYTAEELLTLYRVFLKCEWDKTLDEWTPEQRAQALVGIVPLWNDEEVPIMPDNPEHPGYVAD